MTPVEALRPHLSTRIYNALRRRSWEHGGSIEHVEQVSAMSDAELLEIRMIGRTALPGIRDAVAKALGPVAHVPARGSDVEAWLKCRRDGYLLPDGSKPPLPTMQGAGYLSLDGALDDYRRRADFGLALTDDPEGLPADA